MRRARRWLTVALLVGLLALEAFSVSASPAGPRLFLPLILRDRNSNTTLPDLVVTYAYISMAGYHGGCIPQYTTMVIVACVRNQGPGTAAPFDISVNETFGAHAPGLDAGKDACFDTAPAPYGFSPVTIVVDPANQVPESIETNNTWTALLPIPTPPLLCTATPSPTPSQTPAPPDGTAPPR
jgi:hypothetical protein